MSKADLIVPAVGDLLTQGLNHHQGMRVTEAANLYRKALSIQPDRDDALNLLGAAMRYMGTLDKSASLIRRAIAGNWRVATYHSNLGVILQAAGQLRDAKEAYFRAIILDPALPDVLNNLGTLFWEPARFDEAAAIIGRAVHVRGDYIEARCNLGLTLVRLQRYDKAGEQLHLVSQHNPYFPHLHINLATLYREQGASQTATRHFTYAILLAPANSEFYQEFASFRLDEGQIGEAMRLLDRALTLDPRNARAMNTMGRSFSIQGKPSEAGSFFAKASVLADYADTRKSVFLNKFFDPRQDMADIFYTSKDFSAHIEQGSRQNSIVKHIFSNKITRIGYVSGDFFYHPVGFFISKVLSAHNRQVVEIFCYTNNSYCDAMTDALRSASDHWRSIVGLTAKEASRLIRNDQIDVLVDLSGHTALNRLDVFALRPAPVQVSWLGFYGTTGMSSMDYILMDDIAVPRGGERWFSEQVVRLPQGRFCYGPPNYAPAVVDLPQHRNGYTTFGSFNRLAKVNPEVIALWAKVLKAVPNSRLRLKCKSLGDDSVRKNLLDCFVSEGVSPSHIELRSHSRHREMLAEYGDIDIALDPFPHCGGLTSCEALWMGVPVITLPGEHPVSRQTMGFLAQLDLEFLIASSLQEYVDKAVSLSSNTEKLGTLRHSLRDRMLESKLCNGHTFTVSLEKAFLFMVTEKKRGRILPEIIGDTNKVTPENIYK